MFSFFKLWLSVRTLLLSLEQTSQLPLLSALALICSPMCSLHPSEVFALCDSLEVAWIFLFKFHYFTILTSVVHSFFFIKYIITFISIIIPITTCYFATLGFQSYQLLLILLFQYLSSILVHLLCFWIQAIPFHRTFFDIGFLITPKLFLEFSIILKITHKENESWHWLL